MVSFGEALHTTLVAAVFLGVLREAPVWATISRFSRLIGLL